MLEGPPAARSAGGGGGGGWGRSAQLRWTSYVPDWGLKRTDRSSAAVAAAAAVGAPSIRRYGGTGRQVVSRVQSGRPVLPWTAGERRLCVAPPLPYPTRSQTSGIGMIHTSSLRNNKLYLYKVLVGFDTKSSSTFLVYLRVDSPDNIAATSPLPSLNQCQFAGVRPEV